MALRKVADFVEAAYLAHRQSPLLVCLYTGSTMPRCAEPMARQPEPPVGLCLNDKFANAYREVLLMNAAVHDGAILAARSSEDSTEYSVMGWSHRLFPPPLPGVSLPNRGSAFHSCRAMSDLPEIDGVILFTQGERMIFSDGELQDSRKIL